MFSSYPLPESFSGALKENKILSGAEKLFENQIEGPESIAIFNGSLFTSSNNGFIYRIDINNNVLIPVIKLINNTCETWNKTLCSRPLGMKFNSKGVLYVIEAFFGIFTITDIMTSNPIIRQILSYSQTDTLGKRSKFFDDIAIDENSGLNGSDVLYISDVSTKFDLTEFVIALGASETGRIIRYDINANKVQIVVDNILGPNGIEISDDKSFILFSETITRRIIKHFIRGEKSGKSVTFISGLPGEPDNIRKARNETYWIALVNARTQQNRLLMDWTEDKPLIRKLLFRSLHLTGSVILSIGDAFGSETLKNLGVSVKTGLSQIIVGKFLENCHGMALKIDKSGQILKSLHSPEGRITLLSEVNEVSNQNNTVLYLGSFYNKYLGKLIL